MPRKSDSLHGGQLAVEFVEVTVVEKPKVDREKRRASKLGSDSIVLSANSFPDEDDLAPDALSDFDFR